MAAETQNKKDCFSAVLFVLERVTRLELASAPHKSFAFAGAPHLMDRKERGYTAFLGGGSEFDLQILGKTKPRPFGRGFYWSE